MNPREILIIEVPEDATGFLVDNAMEFLIYKVPNYKTWVSDKVLSDYNKLQKLLERRENNPEEEWLKGGARLHGKYSYLGVIVNGKMIQQCKPSELKQIHKQLAGTNFKKAVALLKKA